MLLQTALLLIQRRNPLLNLLLLGNARIQLLLRLTAALLQLLHPCEQFLLSQCVLFQNRLKTLRLCRCRCLFIQQFHHTTLCRVNGVRCFLDLHIHLRQNAGRFLPFLLLFHELGVQRLLLFPQGRKLIFSLSDLFSDRFHTTGDSLLPVMLCADLLRQHIDLTFHPLAGNFRLAVLLSRRLQ